MSRGEKVEVRERCAGSARRLDKVCSELPSICLCVSARKEDGGIWLWSGRSRTSFSVRLGISLGGCVESWGAAF